MRFLTIVYSVLLVQLLAAGLLFGQTPSPDPARKRLLTLENEPKLRELYLNLNQKCISRLSGEMWSLTHAYESKEEVDKALNYLIDFFKAVESDNRRRIEELNGPKGFKDAFAGFLESKDEAVRAFSAFILGCVGDRAYAPGLARIVDERDPSFDDRFAGDRHAFARGRAAMALGALQATEFKGNIAKLLKSKNESDRSGAICALAEMKALEFTAEIVELMTNKGLAFDDDDSPIYFLIETKQALTYKKEIVQSMLGESLEKVPESAAYALAAIGAKENAKDIAKLLKNEFRRGEAAKALALLGASEYKSEIARLLGDRSILTRQDAALAIAILDAKEYIPMLRRICRKDASSVADALVLLGQTACYRGIPMTDGRTETTPTLDEGDLHYFVRDRMAELNRVLKQNFEKAQKSSSRPY